MRYKDHTPRHYDDNDRSDRCRQIRVDFVDPDFCENGRQRSKNGGTQRKDEPHDRFPLSSNKIFAVRTEDPDGFIFNIDPHVVHRAAAFAVQRLVLRPFKSKVQL